MRYKIRNRLLGDREIDAILARLVEADLTVEEAEASIDRLRAARKRSLPRLMAMLRDTLPWPGEASLPPQPDLADRQDQLLTLLGLVGDASVVEPLLDLVSTASVEDGLKLKVISLLGQLDPDVDPASLLSYLRDPQAALQQSQLDHLRRLRSPRDLALWLEMMEMQMQPEVRASWARSTVELGDPSAVAALICLCYDPDDGVALAAIDAVERFKDAHAIPALEELAARHPNAAVSGEARKAADRLRVRASLVAQPQCALPQPLHACYLTTIDGSGGQVALISRRGEDGALCLVDVMFNDEEGIKHCFGGEVGADELEELLDELEAQKISPVRVSHRRCLAALDQACDVAWEAGHPPPMAYVAWRAFIEGCGPDGGARAPAPDLDDLAPLVLPVQERQALVRASYELLLQDEFAYWFFNPDEIGDLDQRYLDMVEGSGQGLDALSLRCLLRQGVREIVTDRVRGLIRGRLLRMAPLLRAIYEDQEVWQWAAAAADGLAGDSSTPLEDHPLLLGIVARSLENALGEAIDWLELV
jgi:hypothetical protein